MFVAIVVDRYERRILVKRVRTDVCKQLCNYIADYTSPKTRTMQTRSHTPHSRDNHAQSTRKISQIIKTSSSSTYVSFLMALVTCLWLVVVNSRSRGSHTITGFVMLEVHHCTSEQCLPSVVIQALATETLHYPGGATIKRCTTEPATSKAISSPKASASSRADSSNMALLVVETNSVFEHMEN